MLTLGRPLAFTVRPPWPLSRSTANGEFSGVLLAPNAALTMNGGGNSRQGFTGALMVNSVRMNGHFNFQHDETLGRVGGSERFLITAWAEVD